MKNAKKLTSAQLKKCSLIIHATSAEAALVGGGLAQAGRCDTAIITPLQVKMIIELGHVLGATISKSAAKSKVCGSAATVGRMLSKLLTGWIPGAGNVINATTAAALTETLGWMVADEFAAKKAA